MSEKPTYETSIEVKQIIDLYLFEMAKIECNLGEDSSEMQIQEAQKAKQIFMDKIKAIDEDFYNSINP